MTATQLRDQALEQVSEHNVRWKNRAMVELKYMRNRAKNPKTAGQLFTFEDILPDLEYLVGSELPTFNLAGEIMIGAIRNNYVAQTGAFIQTKGDKKHSRKAAQYKWVS